MAITRLAPSRMAERIEVAGLVRQDFRDFKWGPCRFVGGKKFQAAWATFGV